MIRPEGDVFVQKACRTTASLLEKIAGCTQRLSSNLLSCAGLVSDEGFRAIALYPSKHPATASTGTCRLDRSGGHQMSTKPPPWKQVDVDVGKEDENGKQG